MRFEIRIQVTAHSVTEGHLKIHKSSAVYFAVSHGHKHLGLCQCARFQRGKIMFSFFPGFPKHAVRLGYFPSVHITMCRSSPNRMVALTASWSSLLVTTSTRPYGDEWEARDEVVASQSHSHSHDQAAVQICGVRL